jgi:hypothetical protein
LFGEGRKEGKAGKEVKAGKEGGTNGRKEGRKGEWKEGRTNGRKEGRTNGRKEGRRVDLEDFSLVRGVARQHFKGDGYEACRVACEGIKKGRR